MRKHNPPRRPPLAARRGMEDLTKDKVAVVVRARPPRVDGGRRCVTGEGACTVLTHDSGHERSVRLRATATRCTGATRR